MLFRSREDVVLAQLEPALAGRAVDLVVSDMAPNLSGVADTDAARIELLVELAVDFASRHLKPQGALVAKVFHGGAYDPLLALFKDSFRVVKPFKPKSAASRRSKSASA